MTSSLKNEATSLIGIFVIQNLVPLLAEWCMGDKYIKTYLMRKLIKIREVIDIAQ